MTFPGVELSCDSSKVHMLIIFDVICTGDEVREFLNSMGIYKNSLGESGNTCEGNIKSVCDKAHEMDGLVIAAHIDEFNGISEISYDNMKEILNRKYIDAVQVVNSEIWEEYEDKNDIDDICLKLSEKYGKTISANQVKEWHNAFTLAEKSELPMLAFSDNTSAKNDPKHGLWGIGKNYTWLKMNGTPDLESVRQALLSYDMRVKSICESVQKPDSKPELWINCIKAYDTKLNPNEIAVNFNSQLNVIIGGRGSGKSSIIRMLAGGMKSFDADSLDSIRQDQENFYKLSAKDKKGVFNGNSKIEIFIERASDTYKLVISDIRNMNSQVRVLYKLVEEEWIEIEDPNYVDFFKAQIYTQKQIYEMALDSNSLLSIIDEDIDVLSQKLDEREASFSQVIAKWLGIWNLQNSIEEEAKVKTEISDIEEQINKYEKSGISAALNEKQKFAAEKKVIDDYFSKKNEQIEKLNNAISEIFAETIDYSCIDNQEIRALIEHDFKLLEDRKKAVLEAVNFMNEDTNKLSDSINKSKWNKQMEDAEKNIMKFAILYKIKV